MRGNIDMKIYSRLRLISNDDSWFDRLSIKEKNAYIKEHPNSKFAKEMFDDIEDNQSRTEYKDASNKYHNYWKNRKEFSEPREKELDRYQNEYVNLKIDLENGDITPENLKRMKELDKKLSDERNRFYEDEKRTFPKEEEKKVQQDLWDKVGNYEGKLNKKVKDIFDKYKDNSSEDIYRINKLLKEKSDEILRKEGPSPKYGALVGLSNKFKKELKYRSERN